MFKKIIFFLSFSGINLCHAQLSDDTRLEPRRVRPVPHQTESLIVDLDTLLVTASDSIESFLLHGWLKDTSTLGLEGFLVKKVGPILKGELKTETIAFLNNKKLYSSSNWAKRCAFAPHLGYRIRTQSKTICVLMALNCDSWQFSGFAQPILKETTPAHAQIEAFSKKIFGTSEIIQILQDDLNYKKSLKDPEDLVILVAPPAPIAPVAPVAPITPVAPIAPVAPIQELGDSANSLRPRVGSIPPNPPVPIPAGNAIKHFVARGETLKQIAATYKVSETDLKIWNALHQEALKPQQVLIIYIKN